MELLSFLYILIISFRFGFVNTFFDFSKKFFRLTGLVSVPYVYIILLSARLVNTFKKIFFGLRSASETPARAWLALANWRKKKEGFVLLKPRRKWKTQPTTSNKNRKILNHKTQLPNHTLYNPRLLTFLSFLSFTFCNYYINFLFSCQLFFKRIFIFFSIILFLIRHNSCNRFYFSPIAPYLFINFKLFHNLSTFQLYYI